jgi:hypothetical protein
VALLVALVGTELGLRAAGIPYSSAWVPAESAIARFDPELGWSYIPDISLSRQSGGRWWSVFINRYGVRVPRPAFEHDPDQPSLVLIGGSYAFGHGLSYGESLSGQLEGRVGPDVQVVNLGVQAYGSDQALLALRRHLPRFRRPAAVVYVFMAEHIIRNGVSDRRLLIPSARFLGTKPRFELSAGGGLELRSRPHLYRRFDRSWLVDLVRIRVGRALGVFPPYPENLTRAIVLEMKRTATDAGARFLVVNWRYRGDEPADLFSSLGIDTIDTLAPPTPARWADMRIPGDGHPSAEACSRVAGLIVADLTEGPRPRSEPRDRPSAGEPPPR